MGETTPLTVMPLTRSDQPQIMARRLRAIELRKTGLSLEKIAAVIREEFQNPSYNRGRAGEDVNAVLKELKKASVQDANELRQMEVERLDDYLARIFPQIKTGSIRAVRLGVSISERRCKMLGLDAPVQVQVEEIVNRELSSLIDNLEPLLSREVYEQVLEAISKLGAMAHAAGNN